jgi:hypothetical protein
VRLGSCSPGPCLVRCSPVQALGHLRACGCSRVCSPASAPLRLLAAEGFARCSAGVRAFSLAVLLDICACHMAGHAVRLGVRVTCYVARWVCVPRLVCVADGEERCAQQLSVCLSVMRVLVMDDEV